MSGILANQADNKLVLMCVQVINNMLCSVEPSSDSAKTVQVGLKIAHT